MKVQFYTLAPSPHLVGVLDALHEVPSVDLEVVYERKELPERDWGIHAGQAPARFLESTDLVGWGQLWDARAAQIARRSQADIAIVSTSYASLNTYAIIWALRRRDVPFVFWCERFSRLSNWFVDRMRRVPIQWILNRAAAFIGSTRATVDFYTREFTFEGPTLSVPYHRDLRSFLELPLLDRPPDPVRFIVIGSLVRGKGIDVVLKALAQIEEFAELYIVGDGPERERLEHLAEQCQHQAIHFKGAVPYGDVPTMVRKAHVLLFPSRHDGFGMATMEALAGGRPVVASDCVMSALEFVESGTNGWIVPVDDVEAWKAMIRRIVREKRACLPCLSRAARTTVESSYDVIADVNRLVEFLETVHRGTSQESAADVLNSTK